MKAQTFVVRTAAHPRLWLTQIGCTPIKRLALRFRCFETAAAAADRRSGTFVVEPTTS